MATGISVLSSISIVDGVAQPTLDAHDGEELMRVVAGVSIVLGNHPPLSPGTLYISTKRVMWLSDSDRAKSYSVDFLSISLHAVSRDPEAYPSPCIYAQIDNGTEGEDSEDSDAESDEIDLSKITEMRLVPSDSSQLDTLFQIFCECAELNPGPIVDDLGNEEEHNWIFSADQIESENAAIDEFDWISQTSVNAIGANGNHDLAHTVLQLRISDQRFEDAEEEMDDDDTVSRH